MTLYLTTRRARLLLKVLIMYYGILKAEDKEIALTLMSELAEGTRSYVWDTIVVEGSEVVT